MHFICILNKKPYLCILLLHDGAGTSLDDGDGDDLAILVEQLGHTDFLADNAFNHFLFLL